jgi:cell division protease FtsH
MSEKPGNFGRPKRPLDPRGTKLSSSWLLVWFIILAVIPVMWWAYQQQNRAIKKIPYGEFKTMVEKGQVKSVSLLTRNDKPYMATGEFFVVDDKGQPRKDEQGNALVASYRARVASSDKFEDFLELHSLRIKEINEDQQLLTQLLINTLPFVLFIALGLWFLTRQIRMAGRGAMSFGKSRARLFSREKNKVTFRDVAGIEEAKEECQEIIDFLKDPKKFQKLGGRIPKGVLMVGPPGTGKTLLAKAIAGEADVPFFSISGSDFVEMFVGVGASRVRDMFEQGKKHAPCLLFIDEIDAVGRSRFSGIGGGHDEREQTLNALLVEMDGFDTQEGVIIIAATNRPDVLDPALLRPGRFDRQIVIDLPDLKGREEILKVHARQIKLAKEADLSVAARGTPGFSGADLANLINEAALLAARKSKKTVDMDDLEEARDKVRWGRERRSRVMDEKDKKVTAYHEAGHALVLALIPECEPLHKVTIIPRGTAYLGATMQLPQKDKYTEGRKQLLGQITGVMGGRVAEEVIFGDITSGAYSDIRFATQTAHMMVCEWGMSEKVGPVALGEREETLFLGREVTRHQTYSEATAQVIDAEVRRIIEDCYERAKKLVLENKDKLIAMAEALLENETLDADQISEIIKTGKLTPPTPAETMPAAPAAAEAPKQGAGQPAEAFPPATGVQSAPASG